MGDLGVELQERGLLAAVIRRPSLADELRRGLRGGGSLLRRDRLRSTRPLAVQEMIDGVEEDLRPLDEGMVPHPRDDQQPRVRVSGGPLPRAGERDEVLLAGDDQPGRLGGARLGAIVPGRHRGEECVPPLLLILGPFVLERAVVEGHLRDVGRIAEEGGADHRVERTAEGGGVLLELSGLALLLDGLVRRPVDARSHRLHPFREIRFAARTGRRDLDKP